MSKRSIQVLTRHTIFKNNSIQKKQVSQRNSCVIRKLNCHDFLNNFSRKPPISSWLPSWTCMCSIIHAVFIKSSHCSTVIPLNAGISCVRQLLSRDTESATALSQTAPSLVNWFVYQVTIYNIATL
jgi:hypothetical protein